MALTVLRSCGLSALILFLCLSLAHAAPTDPEERRRTNDKFLTGLSALDAGQPKVSIPIFRSILRHYPSLVRVRLELGRAYFFNRQWSESRREFARVLATDIPPAVRNNVLVFISRIDARRGFDWELDLGIARLGNEQDFDTDAIDLNFGGLVLPSTVTRPTDEAWGVLYDMSARFAVPFEPLSGPDAVVNLVFRPFAFGEYAEPESLRDGTFGARAGMQIARPRTTTSIDLVAQRRYVAQGLWETRTGLELRSEHRRGGGLNLFGRLAALDLDNHHNDNLDGSEISYRVGLQQGFSPQFTLGGTLFGEWRDTERDFDTYDRIGLSVFTDIEPGFGLDIVASAYVAWRDYPTPNVLFVDDPDEREIGATLRVQKTDLFLASRFTPYMQLRARRIESGIDAFSYTDRALSFGVEKAF